MHPVSGARRRAVVLLVTVALATSAVVAAAQQGRRSGGGGCRSGPPACERAPYTGDFTFVRVFFEAGGGGMFGFGRGGGGEPPWHHDYPWAERNLSSIVREISSVRTFNGDFGGNIFALDDPEMFRYPVLWLAEPGHWVPTDPQVKALGEYLSKGGFIIFDDFSGRDIENLAYHMRRALPELVPIRMTGQEPIFRSFFEIDVAGLNMTYDGYRSEWWGYFEDNDPTKRQIAVLNYNNDIGEYMDYEDTGFFPVDLTNEAYKLGVNYIVYAMMQ